MMTSDNEVLFAWREFATFAGAVSVLAGELRSHTGMALTQADREAIARVMLKCSSGEIDAGPTLFQWRHNDAPEGVPGMGDLVYAAL